jgi:carbonic anhydrase
LAKGGKKDFTPNYTAVIAGLKASPKIYRYTGSLTTPPCTVSLVFIISQEGVKWHVASSVFLTISPEHYNILKKNMPFNARMTQPLYYASDSNWKTTRKSDFYTS